MAADEMKVGELAKRTGISVRTLHYYEEIGLLEASRQGSSGHRLYGSAELARLQQILSLRQLGFALDEIRACLERSDFSPRQVIETHIVGLKERIAEQRRLCRRLEVIAEQLHGDEDRGEDVSTDDFLHSIQATLLAEKYFTAEQRRELRQRGRELGEERIRQGERQWEDLLGRVRAAAEDDRDPASAEVQALFGEWRELVEQFTGGNPALEKSLQQMYASEPDAARQFGSSFDLSLAEYMQRAAEASSGSQKP